MTGNKALTFEQYKLAISGTERISAQRTNANKYYLSINTAIVGALLFYNQRPQKIGTTTILIASIFGISACLIWLLALAEYKKLNSAKFRLIHKMEVNFPVKFFTEEWELLNMGRKYQKYRTLTRLERLVPISFILLYVLIVALFAK